MVAMRTTDDHPICKASRHLKHHSLLVEFLSMSEWIILVGRPHWQQLQDDYDLGQRKEGGAMPEGGNRGSIVKMPYQNHAGSTGTK